MKAAFIETTGFTASITALLSDYSYSQLQQVLRSCYFSPTSRERKRALPLNRSLALAAGSSFC